MSQTPRRIFRIFFWQRIVSPHMANLAEALAVWGHTVTYVANESVSHDREQMGWIAPELNQAELFIASDAKEVAKIALNAPTDSIHICQGVRGNGLVRIAQRVLAKRGVPQWIIMETVDDKGFRGLLKRAIYRWLFMRRQKTLQGVFAIGWKTSDWLIARGVPQDRIFSFAYFLSDSISSVRRTRKVAKPFRFLFVGQLIKLKRVDHLIKALALLDSHDIELVIIGDGHMRTFWEMMAEELLPHQVRWEGRIPIGEIPQQMANADCLVLPSRHDGWGAVVSEALMVGTPVICSDACGASGAVLASHEGDVFPAGDIVALKDCLLRQREHGLIQVGRRCALAEWGACLGARVGAAYLTQLLQHFDSKGKQPLPIWPPLNANRVIMK